MTNGRRKSPRVRSLCPEISPSMATARTSRNLVLLTLTSVIVLPVIVQWTMVVATASRPNILPHESSGNLIESTILRYVREIKNETPLVHFIFHASTSVHGNIAGEVIESYARSGLPRMLFHLDDSMERSIGATCHGRQCQTCPKFQHIVAVYQKVTDVKPENWRTLYNCIWNPGAHIAILIGGESLDRDSVDRLLKSFWSLDCGNVVIASLQPPPTHDTGPIYGYDPFLTDLKDGVPSNPGKTYELKPEDILFPEKLKNLQGHGIRTSLYRHRPHATLGTASKPVDLTGATGLDVEVLLYAAKCLNFTVDLKTGEADAASQVIRLPGGKRVGPIGDILLGKSEYLANGQFLEAHHLYNRSLDFVYPRWRSRSVIVVRRASPRPAILRWLRVAEGDRGSGAGWRAFPVLLACVLGFIVLIFYLRILRRRSSGETLLAILGLVLFQNLPKIGRAPSERIFCLVWIYSSFIVCTVYQGNLVNDLTAPPVLNNVRTLRELVERTESLRLMVRPYERRILGRWASGDATMTMKEDDRTRRKLFERAFVQLNFSACLAQMAESRSVACSIDESYGFFALGQVRRYELLLQRDPHVTVVGRARAYLVPPIHILEESLVDFWKTYFVRRGAPYLRMIDRAIARAVEFGLVDKWLKDDRDSRFKEPLASNEPRSLAILHMDYTFAILIIGLLLSTVAFMGEITFAAIRRRER